jgi:hypothetical protein
MLCGPVLQDARSEDALWAMMQGVDGRALLEHMGLAGGCGNGWGDGPVRDNANRTAASYL